jgi:serine/threonine-protein phosphatase 2A activator
MTTFSAFPRVEKNASFTAAGKQIHSDADVAKFNISIAFERIMGFILLLNEVVQGKTIDKDIAVNQNVKEIGEILDVLNTYIDEIPPSTGPRRFGNVAFRQWVQRVEDVYSLTISTYLSVVQSYYGTISLKTVILLLLK